MYLCHQAV